MSKGGGRLRQSRQGPPESREAARAPQVGQTGPVMKSSLRLARHERQMKRPGMSEALPQSGQHLGKTKSAARPKARESAAETPRSGARQPPWRSLDEWCGSFRLAKE